MAGLKGIEVREALESDFNSLETVVGRAFHPVNPYFKRCFPDTTIIRQWWTNIFQEQIENPNCHLLAAFDTSVEDESKRGVGVLCLRLCEADERGAGLWTSANNPFPDDGDKEARIPMFGCMVVQRERLMLGRKHYLLELFGVDHAYKGRGIGGMLLLEVADIADKAGHETFVQANKTSVEMYEAKSYKLEDTVVLPGEDKYTEYLLVRYPSKANETKSSTC